MLWKKRIWLILNTMIFFTTCSLDFFLTGLRFGESVTLLWENMDLDNGKPKVEYILGNVAKDKSE